jgi:uncharacterized protein (TIGR02145 family)
MSESPNKLIKFWHELKRRKVFGVVTTYAATAYIIIEANTSDYLLNGNLDVYLSNNQIFRYKGKPGTVTIPIGNADLSKYETCFVQHVATGNLCPSGWHVPSDDEFKTLETCLGMAQDQLDLFNANRGTDQGAQLKTTSGWNDGGNGTNSSGFSALPAGWRNGWGGFDAIGYLTAFHSSTLNPGNGWDDNYYRSLYYSESGIMRYFTWRKCGYSFPV